MPVVGYCRNLHTNLCPCFLCSKKFSLDNGVEDLLTHIYFTHQVLIDNIERIADFKKYMEYYVERFKEAPLESFTKPFKIEIPAGNSEPRLQQYYLLGEFLPEDEKLRKALHAKRLKVVQRQQKIDLERNYFVRHCFYCHATLEMTNGQFVNHLRHHGFQLGRPEKLVYIEKFIETIEDTFRNLRCLYCEAEFESCRALTMHMEKKGHLKIHPNNSFYDQFYMINYLEFGKTWMDFSKEKKSDPEQVMEPNDDDADWSSWGTAPENIRCLFCDHVCRSWDGTLLHLQVLHSFDFKSRMSRFSFYQQVKIVNYIRRRITEKRCVICDFQSETRIDVLNHMDQAKHYKIPASDRWDHDEYFFCAMKDDMLLLHLEDNVDEDDTQQETDPQLQEDGHRVEQIDNVCHESGLDSEFDDSSLYTKCEESAPTASPVNEHEDLTNDSQNHNTTDPDEINSSGLELPLRTLKLCSSAHMGAGDSAHEIDVVEELNTRKVNESGDA